LFIDYNGKDVPGGMAGFDKREYTYDGSLYHNPPPLFPTTGPWETQAFSEANIDCFKTADGSVDKSRNDCI
jgi:hypothetical protein